MEKTISAIEIFTASRDGKEKKADEVIHEQEILLRIDRETHKFYCIPVDLEAMMVGNLKSRGANPSLFKIRKITDNEYNVVYDEKSKPYILRLLDEKRRAFNVVQKYFVAFENADYKSMSALATDRHNKNIIHDGDVWGMKWAKAKEIKFIDDPKFLGIDNLESTIVFGISVDMETAKTSAQYPSTQTFFYVVLVKGEDGIWRVDNYTTG